MKRIILSSLLVLLLSTTIGCINIVPRATSSTEQPAGDHLTKYDLDNDEEMDKLVYEFAEEEVADDVYLKRTLEFEKVGEGAEGKISLQFDDKSNGNTNYTHVERIPKEFATSVEELQFSVPPDEIINPDPDVAWEKRNIDVAAGNLIEITENLGKWDSERIMYITSHAVAQINKNRFARIKSDTERDKAILQAASELADAVEYDVTDWYDEWAQQACNQCSQPYTLLACTAILTGKPEICDSNRLSKDDRDLCKAIYIQHKCDVIANKQERERCYFESAVNTGCEIACGTITDADNRNLCLAAVKDDVSYCEKIQDQDTYKRCLEAFGKSTEAEVKDECAEISDVAKRDACYEDLAYQQGDCSICDRISNANSRDMCNTIIGEVHGDVSCCEKSTTESKYSCYKGAACTNCQPFLCDNMPTEQARDRCLSEVAKKCQDPSICEMIKTDKIKWLCQGQFPEQESNEMDEQTKMEYLQDACNRGIGSINYNDGTCWRCVDGKPVQIPCD